MWKFSKDVLVFQEAGVPTGAITGIMHYLEKAKKKASEREALHMIHCNPSITLYMQYCPWLSHEWNLDLHRAAQLPLLHSSTSPFYTHPASTIHPSQPLSGTPPASTSTHSASTTNLCPASTTNPCPASTTHTHLPTTVHPSQPLSGTHPASTSHTPLPTTIHPSRPLSSPHPVTFRSTTQFTRWDLLCSLFHYEHIHRFLWRWTENQTSFHLCLYQVTTNSRYRKLTLLEWWPCFAFSLWILQFSRISSYCLPQLIRVGLRIKYVSVKLS